MTTINDVERTYVPAGQYSQPASDRNAVHAMLEIADAIADGQEVTATRDEGMPGNADSWLYSITVHNSDGGRVHYNFTD